MGRQSCRNDNDMDDVCHPQIVKLKIKTELSCVYIKTTNLKEEILQKTEIGVEYSVPSWFQNLEINHTKEQNRPQARTILMFRTPTIKVLNSVSWVCVCVYTHTYVRTYILELDCTCVTNWLRVPLFTVLFTDKYDAEELILPCVLGPDTAQEAPHVIFLCQNGCRSWLLWCRENGT